MVRRRHRRSSGCWALAHPMCGAPGCLRLLPRSARRSGWPLACAQQDLAAAGLHMPLPLESGSAGWDLQPLPPLTATPASPALGAERRIISTLGACSSFIFSFIAIGLCIDMSEQGWAAHAPLRHSAPQVVPTQSRTAPATLPCRSVWRKCVRPRGRHRVPHHSRQSVQLHECTGFSGCATAASGVCGGVETGGDRGRQAMF